MSDESGLMFATVNVLALLLRLIVAIGFVGVSAHLWRRTRIQGSAEMTIGFGAVLILSLASRATTMLTDRVITDGGTLPTWFWVIIYTVGTLQICAQLLALYGVSRLAVHLIGSARFTPAAA